jgi:hypothetical protein
MSDQKKKISLHFGRMSGAQISQMSSDTIGDLGPSKIDQLVASIDVTDENAIKNFGNVPAGALEKAIADLEAFNQVAQASMAQRQKGMEELKKSQELLTRTIEATAVPPSLWKKAKGLAKGIFT